MGMSSTTKQRSLLITGDLTLFHDMNGLMMARKYQLPIDILVVDNNGGAIFSFLPQATEPDYFELLFGTPLDLDMAKVAQLYELPYVVLSAASELKTVLANQVAGPRLIVFQSNRQNNVADHQQLLGEHHE